jgi:hypothetical protein
MTGVLGRWKARWVILAGAVLLVPAAAPAQFPEVPPPPITQPRPTPLVESRRERGAVYNTAAFATWAGAKGHVIKFRERDDTAEGPSQEVQVALEVRVVSLAAEPAERIGIDWSTKPTVRYELKCGSGVIQEFAPNECLIYHVPALAYLAGVQVHRLLETAQADCRTAVTHFPTCQVYDGQPAKVSTRLEGKPQGLDLDLTPTASADRRFVWLHLEAALNETTPLYIEKTGQVPDGGTVVIGGLKSSVEVRQEYGPPVLQKIPYINRLFRTVGYGREERSLLILVTPRILVPDEVEEVESNHRR